MHRKSDKKSKFDAIVLYASQTFGYISPLVVIPHLLRVFGAENWGLIVIIEIFARNCMILVEYGFSLSATREAAVENLSSEKNGDILTGVQSAKIILSLFCASGAILFWFFYPKMQAYYLSISLTVFWIYFQSSNVAWFLQGKGIYIGYALTDISVKLLSIALIYLFVNEENSWTYFLIYLLGSIITYVYSLLSAHSFANSFKLSFYRGMEEIRNGFDIFLYRGGTSALRTVNIFILGFFVSPYIVGNYAVAERLIRASINFLSPITQLVFPKISTLIFSRPKQAYEIYSKSMILLLILGSVFSISFFILNDFIINYFAGRGYKEAGLLLKLFSPLPVITALSNAIGLLWLVPKKDDTYVRNTLLFGGGFNIITSIIMINFLSSAGLVISICISETIVLALFYFRLKKR